MAEQRYAAVLLFGAPGVGKGTQGRILGQIPGVHHVSSGDIFRSFDADSPEREEFREYISRGELVPDDLTIRIWKRWMEERVSSGDYDPGQELLLMDGIPRSVRQCELLEDYVDVLHLIHLACQEEDVMVQRILGRALEESRVDDANEEIIRRRFEIYRKTSAPLLDHYSKSLITEIDPIGTHAEVLYRILGCLIPVQKAFFAKHVPLNQKVSSH